MFIDAANKCFGLRQERHLMSLLTETGILRIER
jgi:hypothetical protein